MKRKNQSVRERPDVFNPRINTFSGQLHSFRYGVVSKFARGKLLDVGCGIGNLLEFVENKDWYYGIDSSQEAIKKARDIHGQEDRFSTYDGKNIPFPDNSFDILSYLEVIEHLDRAQQGEHIEEIRRVTKPGGLIVLSTPNRNYPLKIIKKKLFKWKNPFHKYEFKTKEFIEFLRSHSLDVVEVVPIGDPLNFFGNFITEPIFFRFSKIRSCSFKSSLFIAKLFKSFCNDVLVVCQKKEV